MARHTSLRRWWPRPGGARPTWSIRAKILTLLLLPVVPLLAMWMFTTSATLGPAVNLFTAVTNLQSAGQPSAALVDELQDERGLSMAYAGGRHDAATKAAISAARTKTDAAVAALHRNTGTAAFRDAESDLTRGYLDVLSAALARLPAVRAGIDRTTTPDEVMTYYDGTIDDAFGLYGSITGIDDHDLARQAATVVGLMQAREMFTREDAIVTGAVAARRLTPEAYQMLVGAIGTQRYLYQQATRFLPADDQRGYQATLSSVVFTQLRGLEDQLSVRAGTKTGLPTGFKATAWRSDFDTVNGELKALESTESQRTIAATKPAGERIVVRLAVAGGIGLLVLIALIIVSVRIARGIIARVHGLRTDALTLARDRLPGVVARLRRGEAVDVSTESPTLAYGHDELGQLGEAFSRAQRTAIASAVQEAELRNGLNEVFLNIARRSQTLLHRQLALLDDMERRVTDPDDLAELFRIDHLATRMRRHAEDLVILAGATPGRGWRYPVAFVDVLRAAAAEVELYTRISVRTLPDLALAGRAVGDTVHLIAELLENATTFSPPETQVTVSAQVVPHGCAIEIEDRGIGMTAEEIEAANVRLATPSDFHPSHSSRLGLFVVARLAARHGIRVTLQSSPYGGVTAIVLLPPEIVVAEPETAELEPAISGTGARMLTAVRTGTAVIDGTVTDETTSSTVDADATDTAGDPADHGEVVLEAIDGEVIGEPAVADHAPSVPRQRNLTLVTPPESSTVEGVTADGLPQRVRPSGRPGRAVRLVPDAVPAQPSDGESEPTNERTDGDATPLGASRTPERMRTMLESFQDGTTLGRRRAQASNAADPAGDIAPTDDAAPADNASAADRGDKDRGDKDRGDKDRGDKDRGGADRRDAHRRDADGAGSEHGMPDR